MQHFTGFNAMFMEKIGFPQEAQDCFNKVLKRLDDEPENGFVFDEIHMLHYSHISRELFLHLFPYIFDKNILLHHYVLLYTY